MKNRGKCKTHSPATKGSSEHLTNDESAKSLKGKKKDAFENIKYA